mmetsp:Transcript_22767/g.49533  ORF Transcript_22767/g.49533 Transcript_22767/m.49533 type:complete len:418 (-) Transcript_22767:977-2230(-)|eukprot:CAMPEP_0168177590 /NCGR_PEP_ID=MMETSP0139_2-20121125/8558_1 /TAXON_ID=44445 /ORGANISM="Pseudo-nitzschia australis, Strain 10249 10 AB" /LENGTH=417 /DNA_ID=CAMNT_0008096697 /DNA_START=158 /DNA_END=1411 /DNA_ORIENTATION=-
MSRRSIRERKVKVDKDCEGNQGNPTEDEQDPDKEDPKDKEQSGSKRGAVSEPNQENDEATTQEEETTPGEQPLWKRKKRKKKEFKIDEVEQAKPTYTRKTDNGGYAHTNLSKSRISQANKGNKPWNFGRRRSSADKAKIAAGVRARNRSILLHKLKHLGMTEEEYLIKKKEIKYLRERIRRAKQANGKHLDQKIEKKLQEAIDATNLKKIILGDKVKKSKTKKSTNADSVPDHVDKETKSDEESKDDEEQKKVKQEEVIEEAKNDEQTAAIFIKEITFRPFPQSSSYDQSCSKGGPGGLICCESCSTKYNLLLTRTSEDVEIYRMNKEAGEVTEILDFLNQKKESLEEAVNSAKKKIPPLPPPGSGRLGLRQEPAPGSRPGSSKKNVYKPETPEINPGAWNFTSSIDLGFTGGFASV